MAADAILVGDPGRALALAQLVLDKPRMANHARGLWGYSGKTPAGRALTVQATGMGAPSAAIVIGDLASLGVERVIRIGTCIGVEGRCEAGETLLVGRALGGDGVSLGLIPDGVAEADPALRAALEGSGKPATIASADRPAVAAPADAAATDLQTAAVLAVAAELGIPAAALLVVERVGDDEALYEELEEPIAAAGGAAADAFSTSG